MMINVTKDLIRDQKKVDEWLQFDAKSGKFVLKEDTPNDIRAIYEKLKKIYS